MELFHLIMESGNIMQVPFLSVVFPSSLLTGEMLTLEELEVCIIDKRAIQPSFKLLKMMCGQFTLSFNTLYLLDSSLLHGITWDITTEELIGYACE